MGAVNIFLGGTGKSIAEDIQDSKDFYGLPIGDPVAFDLNATVKPGVKLDGFVPADAAITGDVTALVDDWVTRDPGPALGPGAGKPGPQLAPEHSVLVSVGEGVKAAPAPAAGLFALRAHGLAVFSVLFDDKTALAGAGSGNALRQIVDAGVKAQTIGGAPPRINIVTSTAGGTGAGMAIPLALWLKQRYPDSPLNLLAVTASAFGETLNAHPELRAKGLSGTYAMLREISYFRDADPRTVFAERRLPVIGHGLPYRPGSEPFDRVYWFGGRHLAASADAFREAEPLLRVLSWDDTADDLRAETGAHPDKWIGAVTAIEYPKLRLQRRTVSRVLEDAYRSLREPPAALGGATPPNVSLLGYVGGGAAGRPLGAWFHSKRHGAMAPTAAGVGAGDADDLSRAVRAAAGLRDYDGVPHGTDIPGDNYESDEKGWQLYVNKVASGLQDAASHNQEQLRKIVATLRQAEEDAFRSWLRGTAYEDWLSATGGGEPRSTGEALEWLGILEDGASGYAKMFGDADLFPVGSVDDANAGVQLREEKFEKPDPRDATANARDRVLSLAAAAAAGVLGTFVAEPVAEAVPEFAGGLSRLLPWAAVVLGAFAARRIALGLMLRGRAAAAKESAVRKAAELALFAAHRERDRVRALRWLHEELRGEGAKKGASFFEALRQRIVAVRSEVQCLDDVYAGLQDRAAGEKAKVDRQPAHVHGEVGDCLSHDVDAAALSAKIGPEVRRRVAVESASAAGLRLCLRHVSPGEPFEPAVEDVGDLRQALEAKALVGYPDAAKALARWERAAEEVVNWKLDTALPADFEAALLHCADGGEDAALNSLVTKLQNLDLPRSPSVALGGAAGEPGHRRLYAGSAGILARLNAATSALGGAKAAMIDEYRKTPPQVVGSLGEQIVFLDLWADLGAERPWAPKAIGNAREIVEQPSGAMRTHYGLRPEVPAEWTALERAFTVVPELLAATKIEIGAGPIEPLAHAVAARLLGCDLDMRGPTYAELFYLLRHRGLLRSRDEGAGPAASTVTEIGDGDGAAMPLVSRPKGNVAGDTAFGAGRAAVIDFDAFVEFMRYGGTALMAGEGAGFRPFATARPHVDEWATDSARTAELQHMAVQQWYAGDVDGDAEAMLAVLEGDLAAMANGDAAVRSSWERAMRRLLAGKERKEIRSILAASPPPPAPAGP